MATNILDISYPNGTGGSSSSSSSSSTGGGNSTYSNISGDFVATPNNGGKTITLSAFASSILSGSLSAANFAAAVIKRVTSAGVVTTLPITSVTYNSGTGVLTLADMTENFAAGDTVAVFVLGPDKALDEAGDYQKSSLMTRLAGEDIVSDVQKIEQRGNNVQISAAATTIVKAGPGHINSLRCIGGVLGAVTVYDNGAASGTVLLPTVTPVNDGILLENVDFAVGLTIVTAAATIITGSVR